MKIDEIETNSEQIREILEKPPTKIMRWGITVMFLIVFAFFFAAWIIKYPTVIPAQITITSNVPPNKIIARSNGKITQLFVSENDIVEANQVIAVIENTAHFEDVELLRKEVEKRGTILEEGRLLDFEFIDHLKLGNIQDFYSNFKSSYQEFHEYYDLLESNQEVLILNNQIEINKGKLDNRLKQLSTYNSELSLAQKDYDRHQNLFNQNGISAKELEDKKKTLLTVKRNYENAKNDKANVEIIISNLKKDINSINISRIESKNRLSRNVIENFDLLKNAILNWRQQFLLVSSIEGTVSFFNFLAKNQEVNIGDEILSIVPIANNQTVGKMLMPVQNSGEVKPGQKVLIRLNAYPYQEYGMLIGKIKTISLLPSQETYAVEVDLSNELMTTFNKKIEFKSELSGTAEVITEDLRLLERIFYQIRKVFND